MPLLLMIALAGCGDAWEQLDGTWLCDAKTTIGRERGIKNLSQQQMKEVQAADRQIQDALTSLFVTVNTKTRTITSNIRNPFLPAQEYDFEPSVQGGKIVLTSKAGPTLHFKLQDKQTALIWFTGGAAMVFVRVAAVDP